MAVLSSAYQQPWDYSPYYGSDQWQDPNYQWDEMYPWLDAEAGGDYYGDYGAPSWETGGGYDPYGDYGFDGYGGYGDYGDWGLEPPPSWGTDWGGGSTPGTPGTPEPGVPEPLPPGPAPSQGPSSPAWWRQPAYGTGYRPQGAPGTGAPWYDVHTASPQQMFEQDRLAAYNIGHTLDQGAMDDQNRYQNIEAGFMDQYLSGPGGYGDILEGRGGYSPEQEANLIQDEMLRRGIASDDDLGDLGLKEHEETMIAGDPWQARDEFYDQMNEEDLQGDQQRNAERIREGVGSWESEAQSAIDPRALRLRPEYAGEQAGYLDAAESGLRETINPEWLGLSDEFQQDYAFGDRDAQDMVDQAGRQIGVNKAARLNALQRSVAAHGNTSPLALEAAREEMEQGANIAGANAMTDARIRAKQLGLDVTQDREQMRLGTERDMASRNQRGIEWLTGERLGAGSEAERMRLGSEQDVSNRQLGVAGDIGRARIGTESDIGRAEQDVGRWYSKALYDTTRDAEEAATRRAQYLAANRQAAQGQKIDTRYGQNVPASQMLSNRYGSVYGQRKGEEAEGRRALQYLHGTGFEGASLTRQQRANNAFRTLDSAGRAGQGAHQAWLTAEQLPKWWEKALNIGIGAASAFGGGG